MEFVVGADLKELVLFTECSGFRVQNRVMEFVKEQWKIAISLKSSKDHSDSDSHSTKYKVRLFKADDSTYLGIKEDGKSVEIVLPADNEEFSLKITDGVYLQFNVRKLEDDCDGDYDDSDYDDEEYDYDDEEYDCDDDGDNYDDEDDDWDCDDDEEEDD